MVVSNLKTTKSSKSRGLDKKNSENRFLPVSEVERSCETVTRVTGVGFLCSTTIETRPELRVKGTGEALLGLPLELKEIQHQQRIVRLASLNRGEALLI